MAGRSVGNRFAILPMEGWDGTEDGRPTELVERRWRRFGSSGAKLVWGGEAAAVRHEGRANPRQLVVDASTVDELAGLRAALVEEHDRHIGSVRRICSSVCSSPIRVASPARTARRVR